MQEDSANNAYPVTRFGSPSIQRGLFLLTQEPSSCWRRANSAIRQTELIGLPAPVLYFGRQYGDFESLDAWKGKVVIIDFTAHW